MNRFHHSICYNTAFLQLTTAKSWGTNSLLFSLLKSSGSVAPVPAGPHGCYAHDCYSTDPDHVCGEYSQVVNNEPYCFLVPIFLPDEEQQAAI